MRKEKDWYTYTFLVGDFPVLGVPSKTWKIHISQIKLIFFSPSPLSRKEKMENIKLQNSKVLASKCASFTLCSIQPLRTEVSVGFAPVHGAALQSAPFSSPAEEVASASGSAGLQPPPCLPLPPCKPQSHGDCGTSQGLWGTAAGETSGAAAVLIHWWLWWPCCGCRRAVSRCRGPPVLFHKLRTLLHVDFSLIPA